MTKDKAFIPLQFIMFFAGKPDTWYGNHIVLDSKVVWNEPSNHRYFITISATALRVSGYLANSKVDTIMQQVSWRVTFMFFYGNDINAVNR